MDSPTSEQLNKLDRLLGRLCDQQLVGDDLAELDQLLHDYAWARQRYFAQMELHGRLTWDCGFSSSADDDRLHAERAGLAAVCRELACETPDQPPRVKPANRASDGLELLGRMLQPRTRWLWAASLAMGACLLVWASLAGRHEPGDPSQPRQFAEFVGPAEMSVQRLAGRSILPAAATFTRTTNVLWEAPDQVPTLGGRAGTQLMRVRSGRVQITFDTGVEVVVEGPAEFSHDGFGGVALNFGTLSAKVPVRAPAFSIVTSSARMVCQRAAEFAVVVEDSGQSELHVLGGTVSIGLLTDRVRPVSEHPLYAIFADQAVRVDRFTEDMTTIDCNRDRFAAIHVQQLDVVDMIAGGDGLGDQLIYGVNALTGERLLPHELEWGLMDSDAAYHQVPWNPHVDGVFIPAAGAAATQLDSDGNTYGDFPTVSGKTWKGGIVLHRTGYEQPVSHNWDGIYNWLQSRDPDEYAGLTGAFLGMHSNCGLTLDLQKVSQGIPPAGRMHRFQAKMLQLQFENYTGARPPVLWIFLDGKLFASYRPTRILQPMNVDVPLNSRTRFLTIVVTDGDQDVGGDWLVLANPVLQWVAREDGA